MLVGDKGMDQFKYMHTGTGCYSNDILKIVFIKLSLHCATDFPWRYGLIENILTFYASVHF